MDSQPDTMAHSAALSAANLSEPGFGNFGVTIGGYDSSTTQIQYVAHCIGLGMASIALPLATYVTYDLLWVRRRPLFTKRKDRYRVGDRVKDIWRRTPKSVQFLATLLLWPIFFSPKPNECLATCFALDVIATVTWHLMLLTNSGPFVVRSIALELCIVFSSFGLLLHLVGIMRAIPVSSTTNMFLPKGSRIQSALFRLKVPSPSILTAVVYFYSLVHIPLALTLAFRFGTATSWPAMFVNFYAHWGQWTLWLLLFSITATVYGLQLIWLLKVNAKDRKALGREGTSGTDELSQGTASLFAQSLLNAQQKLKISPRVSTRSSAASSNQPLTSVSIHVPTGGTGTVPPAPSNPKVIVRTQDESKINHDPTLSTSSGTTTISPSTSFSAASITSSTPSTSPTLLPAPGGAPRKRPTTAATEAQRTRSLKQVKQVLADSPTATMMFVPMHVIMIFTYSQLETSPELSQSWRFIVPVVANILAHGMSQLKVFVPLFLVVWKDRQGRDAGGRGRTTSSSTGVKVSTKRSSVGGGAKDEEGGGK